jgi:hypothetical protein
MGSTTIALKGGLYAAILGLETLPKSVYLESILTGSATEEKD